MKKLTLLKSMLLLCALVAGSGSVWAEDFDFLQTTNTYGFHGTAASATASTCTFNLNEELTSGNVKFIYSSKGGASTDLRWWNTSDGIRVYTNSSGATNQFKIKCTAGEITKIVVTGTIVLSEVSSTGGTISSSRTWTAPALGGVTEIEFKGTHTSSTKNIKSIDVTLKLPTPSDPVDNGSTITMTTTSNMDGWRTFYDETQAYTADANTNAYVADSDPVGSTITLKNIGKGIPAGVPVILKTSDAGYSMTLTKGGSATYTGTNKLAVTTGSAVSEKYRLGYNSTNGVGFYPYSATSPAAGIVYLNVSSAEANALTIDFEEGDVTAIKTLTTNISENKGVVYNLNGQRVDANHKGIAVVNGRKVVIK